MGRGDRKTKRGKISSSSYGNSRPKPNKVDKKKAAA
jgi:ribosomal small subunit protein bTHX